MLRTVFSDQAWLNGALPHFEERGSGGRLNALVNELIALEDLKALNHHR